MSDLYKVSHVARINVTQAYRRIDHFYLAFSFRFRRKLCTEDKTHARTHVSLSIQETNHSLVLVFTYGHPDHQS